MNNLLCRRAPTLLRTTYFLLLVLYFKKKFHYYIIEKLIFLFRLNKCILCLIFYIWPLSSSTRFLFSHLPLCCCQNWDGRTTFVTLADTTAPMSTWAWWCYDNANSSFINISIIDSLNRHVVGSRIAYREVLSICNWHDKAPEMLNGLYYLTN